MATDALKINKTTKRVETLNGFQLHDGTNRVYSDGNKPTPGTLGAVAKSGDTLTGNLKGPEFIQTTPQSNDGAASARKDYVDAKFKAFTVPTGTAPIVVNNSVISIVPSSASTAGSMSAADKSKLDGISDYVVDGKAIKLTGPINFDSLDLTGFYTLYTVRAAKSVNPPPFDYGTLVVVGSAKTAGTFVTQIATDKSSGVTYIRTRNNSPMIWSDWNKQYSEKSKPTIAEINAAPAGFGLGETSGFSLSGKSCNDAIESGFYSVFNGTKDTPYTSDGPSGSSLLVQRWGNGACMQTFISYAADRMHIRRQYNGGWLPWVEVLTENNGVAVSGATMTGALDMKVPDSLGFGKYAIKLNNGSIGGINQLVFGDPSDTSSEGILFPKSGKNDQSTLATDYDSLYAFDGVLKFNGKAAYGEWNKPTSSDTNSLYVELTSTSVDLNTLGGITDANNSSAGVYRQESNANATTANNYPVGLAGTLLVTPSAYGCHQEYTTFTGRKFHRGLKGSWTGTGPWGAWTEFYSESSPKQFVNKVGDTMTGTLKAPDFIQTTAQSTNAAASTRKDYVDAQVRAIDVKNVAKAGDTMTGTLTVPKVLLSAAQGSEVNALTRKDYVDAQVKAIDVKNVAKAGDTMTGNLTVPKILLSAAQGSEVNALTRKDYVDTELNKKLNLTGGTLTGNLTAPTVLVSSAQNTSVNALTRKDYVDTELNKKLSLTGGTVNGALTLAGASVASLVFSDSTGADFAILHANNYTAFREGSAGGDFMTFNGGGVPTVAMVNPVTNSPQLGSGNALTRKDYVDSQVSSRAPARHTHNAADGNYDIVANISLWGQIGSYMYATTLEATGARGPGHIASGANMRAANSESGTPGGGASLPGQWKLMGFVKGTGANADQNTSLWFRVS